MGPGNAASLSIGAVRATWRGGSFIKGPESYKRKALKMGISLHGGSVGQPGMDPSTGDFDIWLKGALRVESLSMGATCKEPGGRAPAGDPEVYVGKALETGISFHSRPNS